jgi:hypothetical protein
MVGVLVGFAQAAWLMHASRQSPDDCTVLGTLRDGDKRPLRCPDVELAWTNQLIRQCQLLSGLLEGTMSHDDAYAFL